MNGFDWFRLARNEPIKNVDSLVTILGDTPSEAKDFIPSFSLLSKCPKTKEPFTSEHHGNI